MKKASKDKTLELEIGELVNKYLRPAVLEWIRQQDELLTKFGDKPKRR